MVENAFRITPNSYMQPVEIGEIFDSDVENDQFWIDINGGESAEIDDLLAKLPLSLLVRRLSRGENFRPGLYPLKNEICLAIPVPVNDVSKEKADQFVMIVREGLVLTLHSEKLLTAEQVASYRESSEWLAEANVASLIGALLLTVSMNLLERANHVRRIIRALEETLDHDPDSIEAQNLIDARGMLSYLHWVAGEQLPAIEGFSATSRPFFQGGGASSDLGAVVTNLRATDRLLVLLDHRLSDIRAGFDMHSQEKTNHRLGILTILSAIFMPITLLAGVWGMNFENMPELGIAYGYPLALTLMCIVGIVMFFFFRKNGWFD